MEVSLGAFIRFANASPKARPRVGRLIAEQMRSGYNPATDFWRPMRQAISRDRKTSRDGAALHQLVVEAPPRRRPSYEEIGERWDEVASRWRASGHVASTGGRVGLGGVQVRVTPLFSEQWADGHIEPTYMWFNKEELSVDTLHGVQRLLALGAGTPDLAPVFIDMRRALAVSAAAPADTDEWLESLGRELFRLAG